MIIIVFSLVGCLNKTDKEKVKLELSNNLSIEGYEVSKDNIYILEKGDYKIIVNVPKEKEFVKLTIKTLGKEDKVVNALLEEKKYILKLELETKILVEFKNIEIVPVEPDFSQLITDD